MRLLAALAAFALLAAGCAGDDGDESVTIGERTPGPSSTGASDTAPPLGVLHFADGDVRQGEPIDVMYTCDGDDISPRLTWSEVPAGTVELVLVVEDPDAPGGTFTHWLAYGYDPAETELPRGVPQGLVVSGGLALRQGVNDAGRPGYGGPCPPAGQTHTYVFRLLALDAETGLDGGASRDELLAATQGHVLEEASLSAPYTRG